MLHPPTTRSHHELLPRHLQRLTKRLHLQPQPLSLPTRAMQRPSLPLLHLALSLPSTDQRARQRPRPHPLNHTGRTLQPVRDHLHRLAATRKLRHHHGAVLGVELRECAAALDDGVNDSRVRFPAGSQSIRHVTFDMRGIRHTTYCDAKQHVTPLPVTVSRPARRLSRRPHRRLPEREYCGPSPQYRPPQHRSPPAAERPARTA